MPYYDEYGYPKPPRPRNDQVDSDPGVAQETRYSYSENNGHKEADAATWDWDSYWDSRIANSRSATAAKKKKQHDQQQGQVPTQKSSQSESSFTTQFDQEERHGYNSKEIEYEDTFIDRYLGNVKKQPQTQHQSHEQNGQQQQQARSNQERNPYESENWFVDYFRNNNGAKLPGVEYLEAVQEFLSDKVVSEHNRGYPHPENLEWETRRLKKRPNKKWNGFWGVNKVQPVPGAKSPKYYQPAPNAPIFPEELRITFRSASFFVIYVMMMGLLFFSVYEIVRYLKKIGKLSLYVASLENMTGLNLTWILILNEVEPTAEFLKDRVAKSAMKDHVTVSDVIKNVRPISEVDVVDASGHPRKGHTLYGDKWLSKTGMGPSGPIPNNYNPLGWRNSGKHSSTKNKATSHSRTVTFGRLDNDIAAPSDDLDAAFSDTSRSHTASRPVSTAASAASSLFTTLLHPLSVPEPEPYHFSENKYKESPHLFRYHIRPRVVYPTRADPDRPALSAIPRPIAAVLDLSDQIWETAVDTAAWGVGVVAVRPAQRVVREVGKVVHGVEEWAAWGGRYGAQSVRRMLGYSKKQTPPLVDAVSSRRFA